MPRFSFGPFTLDSAKRLLTRDGKTVVLTPKAFDTLLVLVEERATAVSKDTLLSRVWPDVIVEESNLAQIVFTLRKALSDDPTHPEFIATVPRHGYRFVADVVEHQEKTDTLPIPVGGKTNWSFVASILTLVVVAAGASAFMMRRSAPTRVQSVAVLPFRLVDSPKGAQYLADGLTDAVIARLTHLHPLVVTPAATVRQYRSAQTPSTKIAEELGVQTLLSGTVHESNGRLLVNVMLVDGTSARQRWAERFDESTADLSTVVVRIAMAAAANLGVPAGATQQALTRRPPPNPDAYDFYLRGRKAFGPGVGTEHREGRERGREWYEKAIQIDPSLAEAYSGLAAVEFGRYSQGWNSGAEALSRSQMLNARAIALDPTLAEPYTNLIVINWTLGHTEAGLQIGRQIEQAGLTDINSLFARASAYHFAGLGEKAAALMARVVALDPASRDAQQRLVAILITARRYKEAIVEAERYFARFGDLARTHQLAGIAHWSVGDLVSARKELETARRLSPADKVIGINLARLLWVSGDRAEARRVAEADVTAMEKMALAYPDNVLTHSHLAAQYGLLGRETSVREQEEVIMRVASKNGGVVSQIAMAYANLGNFDQAIKIWTQAQQTGYIPWDSPGDIVRRYPPLADMPAFWQLRQTQEAELTRLAREY